MTLWETCITLVAPFQNVGNSRHMPSQIAGIQNAIYFAAEGPRLGLVERWIYTPLRGEDLVSLPSHPTPLEVDTEASRREITVRLRLKHS